MVRWRACVTWSKQVRAGAAHDAFGAPVPMYIEEMRSGGFVRPVVLLTRPRRRADDAERSSRQDGWSQGQRRLPMPR